MLFLSRDNAKLTVRLFTRTDVSATVLGLSTVWESNFSHPARPSLALVKYECINKLVNILVNTLYCYILFLVCHPI